MNLAQLDALFISWAQTWWQCQELVQAATGTINHLDYIRVKDEEKENGNLRTDQPG